MNIRAIGANESISPNAAMTQNTVKPMTLKSIKMPAGPVLARAEPLEPEISGKNQE